MASAALYPLTVASHKQQYSYNNNSHNNTNNFRPLPPSTHNHFYHYNTSLPVPSIVFPDYSQQQAFHQFSYQYPFNMAATDPSEMEQFQRLSDQYQAELPGPLIGDKSAMSVLVQEYAEADPAFIVKTQALQATHSAYRAIKGDGQCGWRGAVFGYFETLQQLGDISIVEMEEIRLRSFADTMRMAGIDYDIIEMMFDSTWDLFEDLKKAINNQDRNEFVILEHLNDQNKSDSIVYHFKMMTSAFLQMNPDNYEPFLEMPIADYRVRRIDPSGQEIDQIGLQVLTDAVIAQAGFALEVLYLDRSMGDEVTPHEFAPRNSGKPTIRMLYRPGHYDLIYKDQRQSSSSLQQSVTGLAQPAGMGYTSVPQGQMPPSAFPSSSGQSMNPQHQFGGPAPGAHGLAYDCSTDMCYPMQPHYLPTLDLSYQAPYVTSFSSSLSPSSLSPGSTRMSPSPGPQTPPPHMHIATVIPALPKPCEGVQIRFTGQCFDYGRKHESVPLCTIAVENAAGLSTAHFRNEEFQPQMWNAEEEYFRC